MNASKIIYSIIVEDVQNVAADELDRELSEAELKIVEDKIGEYIDWYDAIDTVLQMEVLNP